MSKKKKIIIAVISVFSFIFISFSAAVVYAWFSNIPRVYTSDQDSGRIARIGMRINLMFERLRPEGFSEGSTITYADGVTATFDPDAEWGTKDNPYIISMSRHMINLYALQRIGYFEDRYISKNFDENGDYITDSAVMPYFLICDPEDASPIIVDGKRNGENIEIQPIGNDEYPFIGCIGGAQQNNVSDPAEAPNRMTSISSGIANFDVVAKPGDVDVGLFGKIGYLGTEGVEGTDFNGAISYINDLLLYDVRVISKNTGIFEQIADHLFAHEVSNIINYEEDHHVGILAGHIEYASITNISVYYSDNGIKAIDVEDSGANYLSDSGFIGLVYNLNPVVSGNSIGSSSGTIIAGSTIGHGNEWGASIDMKTLWDLLNNFQDRNTAVNYASQNYVATKTIIVNEAVLDANGNPTVTEQDITYSPLTNRQGTRYTYNHVDFGSVTVNSAISDLITPIADNSDLDGAAIYTKITYKAETEEAFYISQNGTYLNINASGTAVTTAQNDGQNTKWRITNDGYIWTEILGEKFYLNDASGITVSTTPSTAWTLNADGTVSKSGSPAYYLYYNNGWALTRIGTYYYITDNNGHYLSATAANVTNAGSEAAASKWEISSPTGATTTFSTYINGTLYYLSADGELTTSTSPYTWNNDNGVYYTTIQNIRHNLIYDNGWRIVPASGIKITDGSGHYLTATTGGVGNAAESAAAVWQFSNDSGNTQIYTILNGQKYYLTYNNGLTVSTTATTWNRSGNSPDIASFYITSGGKDYYLTYDGSNWNVTTLSYFTINDGNGNYLRVTGANTFANGSEDNATHFYFTTENGANSSGIAYCIVGGNTYYLYNNNGTLATTTTQNTGTQWQNDGSSLYVTSGNMTYALEYDTDWHIKNITGGKVITDGNGNYLRITGTNTTNFTNTTNINEATRFTFSNNNTNSGTISATINGSTRYLRNNNGTFETSNQNNATTWYNDGSRLYTGNNNNNRRYLGFFNGSWGMTSNNSTTITSTLGYTIGYNGHYLCIDGNGNITDTTNVNNATLWSGNTGSIYAVGTNYYLYRDGNTLRTNTGSGTSWSGTNQLYVTSGNWFNQTYYWVTYNNGWTIANGTGGFLQTPTMTTLTITEQTESLTVNSNVEAIVTTHPVVRVSAETDPAPAVNLSNYTASGTALTFSGPRKETITITETTAQVVDREVYNPPVGETYIPLAWEVNESGDPPFVVSQQNTGYIMSGTVDNRTGNQYGYGDIRVSGYAKGTNIGNSLTSNRLDDEKIRTYMGGTLQTISDYGTSNLVKYAESKLKFQDTLDLDNTNVYGLHFMDAPISKTNTVTIPKAVINEHLYYDYKMPKDCIDFRLRTRGYINFFAGTYYSVQNSVNNTFFSLHQIFRDSAGEINDIKEISKIYGVPGNEKKAYIYQFEGESTPTLPSGEGYTTLFDMAWVKNPSLTWSEKYIYYYEIPVNAGEYALGSVSGKNGAYLMYLDIGTSAANHASQLGSIDFVYDNLDDKIVVVPDTSDTDFSLNYYTPSLVVAYTKNNDEDDAVDIDVFTMEVRRTISATDADKASTKVTFGEADSTHLEAVLQANAGDNLTVEGNTAGESP